MLRHSASLAALAVIGLAGAAGAQSGSFCDTGFQQADLDGDGLISPDERIAAAGTLFDAIDTDDDGELSREEYMQCYGRLAMRQSPLGSGRTAENMTEIDTDSDRRISETEFLRASERALSSAAGVRPETVDAAPSTLEGNVGQAPDAETIDPDTVDADPSTPAENVADTPEVAGGDPETSDVARSTVAGNAAGDQAAEGAISADTTAADPATPLQGTGGRAGDASTADVGTPLGQTGTGLNRYMDKPATDRDVLSGEEFFARASQTFKALDHDRSGELSEAEWEQSVAVRSDISEVLGLNFKALDADESGSISRDEYMADSAARFEEARTDEMSGTGSDASDGVPMIVYYKYQFGL